jgi:hypothetical protein
VGIRDSMSEAAAAYLQPDETVQAVITASNDPWKFVRSKYLGQRLGNRIIVATNRRILVIEALPGSIKLRDVIGEPPRSTQLGPTETLRPHCKLPLDENHGGPLWVPRQFFPDVQQADSWRTVPEGQPGDHSAHATGRICKRCGQPITAGQDARLRGESDWVHDVCPI